MLCPDGFQKDGAGCDICRCADKPTVCLNGNINWNINSFPAILFKFVILFKFAKLILHPFYVLILKYFQNLMLKATEYDDINFRF